MAHIYFIRLQFYFYSFIISLVSQEVINSIQDSRYWKLFFPLLHTSFSSFQCRKGSVYSSGFMWSVLLSARHSQTATFSGVPCVFIAYWRTWGQEAELEKISPYILHFYKNDFVVISSLALTHISYSMEMQWIIRFQSDSQ